MGDVFDAMRMQPDELAIFVLMVLALIFVLGVVLATVDGAIAWRQRREGGGSLTRWAWVSAVFALLQIAPLLAFVGVWLCDPDPWISSETKMALSGATAVNIVLLMVNLLPPVRLRGTRVPLPLVEDVVFLERVADLSMKMGIPVPRVRLYRSTGDGLLAMAWAGGVAAPSLVVTDGVLHRLTPAERDAIVAHELGHLANGSLWMLLGVTPLAAVSAVIAAHFVSGPTALAFGFAFWIGAKRLVSRPVELDCDRRAGRAMGCGEMASALVKIHAVHPIKNTGWLSFVMYAMATHPHLESRLKALHDAAPESERAAIAYSRSVVRQQRIMGAIAFSLWCGAILWSLTIDEPEFESPAFPMLFFVGMTPLFTQVAASWRIHRLNSRRMKTVRTKWFSIPTFLLGIVFTVILFIASERRIQFGGEWVMPGVLALVACFIFLWLRQRKTTKLQIKVFMALQDRDFARALELGQTAPKLAARDTILRHNLALAAGLGGDVPRAIAELEQLRRDQPQFRLAGLMLASFLLDNNDTGRALEVAQETADALKRDPAAFLLVARSARRLGDLERAEGAVKRGLELDPDLGTVRAAAAGIALDQGDAARARELIGEALRQAPGDAYVLTVKAEIALRTGPEGDARRAVDEAVAAFGETPFALLNFEIALLKRACPECEPVEAEIPGS